jgi:hypothetical protein
MFSAAFHLGQPGIVEMAGIAGKPLAANSALRARLHRFR